MGNAREGHWNIIGYNLDGTKGQDSEEMEREGKDPENGRSKKERE